MRISDVKNRTIKILATKRLEIAPRDLSGRRGLNVPYEKEKHESENFDDFFDYESELNNLKPSRELAGDMEVVDNKPVEAQTNDSGFTMMEPLDSSDEDFIIMEEEVEDLANNNSEFKQCVFVKEDGEQCKRQAPKKDIYCKSHRS